MTHKTTLEKIIAETMKGIDDKTFLSKDYGYIITESDVDEIVPSMIRKASQASRENTIMEFNLNGEHCDCSCDIH